MSGVTIDIHPVTPARRGDLLELFGDNGAYANCWCAWFLLTGREFDDATPAERRTVLLDRVDGGRVPGLLAYVDGEPIGWCAVGPRDEYRRMNTPRARTYAPLDDRPAWVINCFYIDHSYRRSGIATALLDAAVGFARTEGAERVEGYPIDPALTTTNAAGLYLGTRAMFEAAGFDLAAQRGKRPVMRLEL